MYIGHNIDCITINRTKDTITIISHKALTWNIINHVGGKYCLRTETRYLVSLLRIFALFVDNYTFVLYTALDADILFVIKKVFRSIIPFISIAGVGLKLRTGTLVL